ncbi:ATP-grasp domain-containing protein [Vallitalea pronyensis]|uniref:ATP-grasp domain-containing protein n=1 Tax=Vallitalea pronyensis TaxID=1348613 RepID=A0A8J8MI41_9FIRM|nr:ATP-grasp domain-containing protein [Vallitalea pronyensis]QUI21951.1 ATP-grasp domain-containing protein [Vallitalea pronyensis]
MKILVTGAGAVLGQAIIKSLKSSHIDLTIVAVDPSPLAVGLYWADKHYLVPMAVEPRYMDEVYKILQIEKPDVLFIGTDVELLIYAQYKKEIERTFGTKVIVSDTSVIEIADDKWLTYNFLKNNGLDYPESCLPGGEIELVKKVGFPLIVKPRVGARAVSVKKVNTIKALEAAIKDVKNPIIQECVGTDDSEYTAGVLVFNDMAKSSIIMRRDLRDGNTFRAYAEPYSPLNKYVEKVAEKLKPYGPVNLQFRISGRKVKIFEINSRFSGTTHFRTLSNVNEVEMCLNHIFYHKDITQVMINPLTVLRYYDEIIIPNNHYMTRVKGVS